MILRFDFAVLDWIQAHLRCDFLDFLMPIISLYAQKGVPLIVFGVILLLFRSHRVCGTAMLAGMAGGLLIGNLCLKNLIARARPCWIRPDVSLLIAVPKDYSFPSCHAMHSFVVAAVLLYYDKRLGIPALVMAVLVSFSRLYLYVHFPTDVLGGAVLGIGFGILIVAAVEAIRKKRGMKSLAKPAEKS